MIRECLLIFVAFCGGEVCGILTMFLPGPREQPPQEDRPRLRLVK